MTSSTVSVTSGLSMTVLPALHRRTLVLCWGVVVRETLTEPVVGEERASPPTLRPRVGEGQPPRCSQCTVSRWPAGIGPWSSTPPVLRLRAGAGAAPGRADQG